LPQPQNLETVHAFFDKVLNVGDFASLGSFAHRDVLVPQSAPGVESLGSLLVDMRAAFANPEYKVMDAVCEGEKVVVRFSAKATHAGKYMGIPASGRSVKLWGVMIFRFEAGGIAEFWSVVDSQGILRQLREP
jgi:steroid delta-isomerase-like uncharacterized protein